MRPKKKKGRINHHAPRQNYPPQQVGKENAVMKVD
jgi:hypothetical protein